MGQPIDVRGGVFTEGAIEASAYTSSIMCCGCGRGRRGRREAHRLSVDSVQAGKQLRLGDAAAIDQQAAPDVLRHRCGRAPSEPWSVSPQIGRAPFEGNAHSAGRMPAKPLWTAACR